MIEIISSKILLGKSITLDRPHVLLRVRITDGPIPRARADRATVLAQLLSPSLAQDLAQSDCLAALARLVLALQTRAGYEVEKFAIVPDRDAFAKLAVEFEWGPAGEQAASLAPTLLHYLHGLADFSPRDLLQKIVHYEVFCADGPSIDRRNMARAARRRGIPVSYTASDVMVLGQGIHQRKMFKNIPDSESHLAVNMSTDKTRTVTALHAAGLPIPKHVEVRTSQEALEAARLIGFPVVVKPVRTDQGVGITLGVSSNAMLQTAFDYARKFDTRIAVEEFIPGDTYRLLVLDGKFLAAARTEAAIIVGDGKQTVRQIIDAINADPRRGPGHLKGLTWLVIDDEVNATLKAHNLTPNSVLPPLRSLRLRSKSNVGLGGSSIAVTGQVHEENRKLAVLCAKIVGLKLAGIDFRSSAIDKPWQEVACGVLEVNTSPGLRLHTDPAVGEAVDATGAVLSHLFPAGSPSRIPVVSVTGTNGKTTTTRLIAHISAACGLQTGRATTEEVAIGKRIIEHGDSAGPDGARHILSQVDVEAAVLETARGGLIKYGLGYDTCDVAVVLNVEADHLGELGIETLNELAAVKRVVADSASHAVILNGDDPRCLAMAKGCKARHVILFSLQEQNPAVQQHLAKGGVAYCLQTVNGKPTIVKSTSEGCESIIAVDLLPMTHGGKARHNVQNAMAAIAAAGQMGFERQQIVVAAQSFMADFQSNPGRLNFFAGLPFEVMFDYAHNAHGFGEIVHFINELKPAGRKLCAFTLNGMRIDDATARQAVAVLAPHFDVFIPYNSHIAKYRRDGINEVFRAGLARSGVAADRIHATESETSAVDMACGLAESGDFVAVLGFSDPRAIWQQINAVKNHLK